MKQIIDNFWQFVNSIDINAIPMEAYLAVSTIMFFAGIVGFIIRKNLLATLISVELVLNAAELNFAVFNRFLFPNQLEGMFFSLFGITIAAAETAVAIAIIINVYRNMNSVDIDKIETMKN
ncbi:MAG: NADH-quinone oxidoreductase subunit NuoK [Bacteroidales bacterium]|jgi:NADH-quinone oxidoreductase subunit K|nr:NADH-quinone oxidoreductase subunit NuoK [Bacteroidales bacterium]